MTTMFPNRSQPSVSLFMPSNAVWEITPAANPGCSHCGFVGNQKRGSDLATTDCLKIVDALSEIKVRQVLLLDGAQRTRPDLIEIIRALGERGMGCELHTGPELLTEEFLRAAKSAGVNGFGLSVDGLRDLHDSSRKTPGAFDRAMDALNRLSDQGLPATVVTRIRAGALCDLPELMDGLIDLNVSQWHIQLAGVSASGCENGPDLLQPYQLAELMPLLAQLYRQGLEQDLAIVIGNNIGYFGPYEHLWRSAGNDTLYWQGCAAGRHSLNLAADGSVTGCLALTGDDFIGGNLLDRPLPEIWREFKAIHAGQTRGVSDLWGFCRGCYYADICKAGCAWSGYSLFNMPGNNPFCHYRVLEMEKLGLRERLVNRSHGSAGGQFALVCEKIDTQEHVAPDYASKIYGKRMAGKLSSSANSSPAAGIGGAGRDGLKLCRNCDCFVRKHEWRCVHCDHDIALADEAYYREDRQYKTMIKDIESLMEI